jgi:ATP-binding cassette subfamily B protein
MVRDLSFTYPGESRPVLSSVDLTLPPGTQAALVGPVGSGKSTLLKLLARLYRAGDEAILLDGRRLTALPASEMHHLLGLVPQEPFVFSATVRENLDLARQEVDNEGLWEALAAAGLEKEVRALPQGLETELGELGHTLSGGQRARLALARVLLMDPPILLLDDPLSAVDPMAEARILRRLAQRRQGKTTLIVSHRPGSLAFAQNIHVLDQGRILAQGSHQELMASCPLYRRLLQRQKLTGRLEVSDGRV